MVDNNADYFKEVFNRELDAIKLTLHALPTKEINLALQMISGRSGNLIIAGLGKSGLIGRKLVATFSSLGTRAFFLHAAEAMHGDLGALNASDLIIAISHSGETDELLRLVAYARNNGNSIIAITGNKYSTLAHVADVTLPYEIEEEACHMNLAPTSSTTIQLMIGDSLAVTLAHASNFKSEDFSRLHPAGSLGKRLLLKVRDIMSSDVPMLELGSTLHDAVIEMTSKRSGMAIVRGLNGSLAGVLTDGDLRRALLEHSRDIDRVLVSSICSKSPCVIDADESLDNALRILRDEEISSLVVSDNGNTPIGAISMHEIERAIGQ
jgi:arabinose-5-phosphate isomerase